MSTAESVEGEDGTKELDPQSELTHAMLRLLDEGLYSDFTIKCCDHTFPVHRSIICTRSSFFSAACNNGFQETSSGQVNLNDDSLIAVQKMIDYFYKLDYDDGFMDKARRKKKTAGLNKDKSITSITDSQAKKTSPKRKTLPPIVNALVYAIADKYDIKGLKTLSKRKFNDCIEDYRDNKKFAYIIRVVYELTPEGDKALRSKVAEIAALRIPDLMEQDQFRLMQREVPDFTLDVLDIAAEYLRNYFRLFKEHDIDL